MTTSLPRIEADPEGAVISVRVTPRAGSDRVVGLFRDALRIAVSAPPDKGRANEAAAQVLAAAVHLPAKRVSLRRGAASRDKTFFCAGLGVEELRARIAALLVTLGTK